MQMSAKDQAENSLEISGRDSTTLPPICKIHLANWGVLQIVIASQRVIFFTLRCNVSSSRLALEKIGREVAFVSSQLKRDDSLTRSIVYLELRRMRLSRWRVIHVPPFNSGVTQRTCRNLFVDSQTVAIIASGRNWRTLRAGTVPAESCWLDSIVF